MEIRPLRKPPTVPTNLRGKVTDVEAAVRDLADEALESCDGMPLLSIEQQRTADVRRDVRRLVDISHEFDNCMHTMSLVIKELPEAVGPELLRDEVDIARQKFVALAILADVLADDGYVDGQLAEMYNAQP